MLFGLVGLTAIVSSDSFVCRWLMSTFTGGAAVAGRTMQSAAQNAATTRPGRMLSPLLDSGGGRDRNPAARLLPEDDADGVGVDLERRGDVVPDPDGERLAERALVPEAREVQLERLRFEAERPRPVLDRRRVDVGLIRDRADRGQLVARHLDLGHARVRERLEAGVGLAPRVAKSDELGGHERNCR